MTRSDLICGTIVLGDMSLNFREILDDRVELILCTKGNTCVVTVSHTMLANILFWALGDRAGEAMSREMIKILYRGYGIDEEFQLLP